MAHFWSPTSPIHCLGCGVTFSDMEAFERETALARQGLREDTNCRATHEEALRKTRREARRG